MVRKKVNLMRIADAVVRHATFKKRRQGLMKKARELSTLCHIKSCVVIYGEGEMQPEVWPSATEAKSVLKSFKAMPELHQCKKMMDQESFLRQCISKLKMQLHKMRRENRERETKLLLHDIIIGRRGLTDLSIEEITNLNVMVDTRLTSVKDRINQLRGKAQPKPQFLMLDLVSASSLPLMPYVAASNMSGCPQMRSHAPNQQGWLMDMAKVGEGLDSLVSNDFLGDKEASTSVGGNMLQHSDGGFPWPGCHISFHPK